MNNRQKLIKTIEEKIQDIHNAIQTWENNLERYKEYLKELNDQLFALKLEINRNNKSK